MSITALVYPEQVEELCRLASQAGMDPRIVELAKTQPEMHALLTWWMDGQFPYHQVLEQMLILAHQQLESKRERIAKLETALKYSPLGESILAHMEPERSMYYPIMWPIVKRDNHG